MIKCKAYCTDKESVFLKEDFSLKATEMTKLLDKIIWVNDVVNKLRQTSPDGNLVYSWKIIFFFSFFSPNLFY